MNNMSTFTVNEVGDTLSSMFSDVGCKVEKTSELQNFLVMICDSSMSG